MGGGSSSALAHQLAPVGFFQNHPHTEQPASPSVLVARMQLPDLYHPLGGGGGQHLAAHVRLISLSVTVLRISQRSETLLTLQQPALACSALPRSNFSHLRWEEVITASVTFRGY